MANTKTQRKLTIAKTKSELIFEWFVNIGTSNIKSRKVIQEKLNKGKSTIYRMIDKMKEIEEEKTPFDALAEVFTLSELNIVIELFNDYQTMPEEEKLTKEEKHEKELKKQKETVNKHLRSMGMKEVSGGEDTKDTEEVEPENLSSTEEIKKETQEQEGFKAITNRFKR